MLLKKWQWQKSADVDLKSKRGIQVETEFHIITDTAQHNEGAYELLDILLNEFKKRKE